ncbi:UDP-glucose/GDP-mannose dehydrogenase family protein [Pelagibacteraceae bacterium]|nr:UDP-glucose/GDP-mannose dehydrogenase family protein [Pelagibacteraceae bacterium]
MKISIIGTGYVGLVTGLCLSEIGHDVICVDKEISKIKKINNCVPIIHENGITRLLKKNINKNFIATNNLSKAVKNSSISIIAVGTPFRNNKIDIKYVKIAAKQIGRAIKEKKEFHVIVVKSTVVPGTTDKIIKKIVEKESGMKVGLDFGLSMNPEFLREGEAVNDFMYPDRIIIGSSDVQTERILVKMYNLFKGVKIIKTNNQTAELIKYTSNSLLASLISFSNEISNLSERIGGIDIKDVMNGIYYDKRISPFIGSNKRVFPPIISYLESGCGFGGSCFPKDVKALISQGEMFNLDMSLLKAVININENQPKKMIDILKRNFKSLENIKVAILGLAFKPETNDVRESPSLKVIKNLNKYNVSINAYDPVAKNEAKKNITNKKITYKNNLKAAIKNVDAILIMTKWREFSDIPNIIKKNNPDVLIIDGRRIIKPSTVSNYVGIGLS